MLVATRDASYMIMTCARNVRFMATRTPARRNAQITVAANSGGRGAALPAHGDAGAVTGGRNVHVVGEPGDDRQAYARGKLQDHAVGSGTAVPGGSAASGTVTAPRCRSHGSLAVRVRWGRVGH